MTGGMRTAIPWILLALALPPIGCVSNGSGPPMEASRGVVINHAPGDVWLATRSVMTRVGRGGADLDPTTLEAKAVVQGIEVTVRVEAYSPAGEKTILRVISDEKQPTVAQDVQDWILAQLPRW
jgi:hypothetical protein